MSAETHAPRVLLASTQPWPLACRLAMGLAAHGCHVEAWCPVQHPLAVTRAVRRRHRFRPFAALTSLQQAIADSGVDLIIACDDDAVLHLNDLYRRVRQASPESALANLISRSLGDPDACVRASTRATLMQIAAGLGLRIPLSADLEDLAAVDRWTAEVGYPAVFKASPSWGGRGVLRVNNRTAARAAFGELTRNHWNVSLREQLLRGDSGPLRRQLIGERPSVMAQRYIVGHPANRAVACWRGEVLDGISVRALETRGATGPATVIEVIDPDDMRRAATRTVEYLGLTGFCGLDFMIESGSGDAYLIEMNPRATPICHLALGPGRDPVGAFVARLRGDALPDIGMPPAAEAGAEVIALFPGEWLRDPHSRYLQCGHHDVPWSEPALVEDCTGLPWEARGPLARLRSRLRGTASRARPFLMAGQSGQG